MPILLDALRSSQQRPQRFYAAACVANASAHPKLAGVLNQNGGMFLIISILVLRYEVLNEFHYTIGLGIVREIERQSLANLHILGSKLGDCARTAVYRLSERKEGDPKMGNMKYRYLNYEQDIFILYMSL